MAAALQAAPRSDRQMQEAARAAIMRTPAAQRSMPLGQLSRLKANSHLQVLGYADGPFAVVSRDDRLPEVLAVAEGRFNEDNPGLNWWMEAVGQVAAQVEKSGRRHTPSLPSAKKHPPKVEPLIQTKWGQEAPFNDLCPVRGNERTVTGCVATSMAQVLFYNKYPARGCGGTNSVTVPYDDPDGDVYELNFDELTFAYDDMLPDYSDGYTEEQGLAVAQLMYACGIAANMHYDVKSVGGSGTLSNYAQTGLNNFLGFEGVKFIYRDAMDDRLFMDIVYTELAAHRPMIYGGQGSQGGHSFVLCGYNEEGLVYVNWGWNGDANGYYDIDLLNPKSYAFPDNQDLVYNIKTFDYEEPAVEVVVAEAGTLHLVLPAAIETGLKVAGPINSTDLKTIRTLLGCSDRGVYTDVPRLNLDLSEATIVAGGEPYLIEGNKKYTTADNEIPYKAFYNCQSLRRMKLPKEVVHIGDGAWGNCVSLWTVVDNDAEQKDFCIEDDCIYSADHTELIAALPVERLLSDTLVVGEGVTTIHPYAFSGYQELAFVDLPRTLASIGAGAFQNSTAISGIKLRAKELPALGKDAFAGMSGSCRLYLWAGLKQAAQRKSQWKDFYDIIEYGTTITATHATRARGEENPVFGYTTLGQPVQGQPELVCDATPDSPVGTYVIRCLPGTITASDVDYVDGRLIVTDPDPSAIAHQHAAPDARHAAPAYDLRGISPHAAPNARISISKKRKFIVK